MPKAKIKKEFATTRVAFGQSGKPLGNRDDIDELAIMAHKSQDPSLLKLFETLPGLDELQAASTKAKLPAVKKAEVKPATKTKVVKAPVAKKDEHAHTAKADEAGK